MFRTLLERPADASWTLRKVWTYLKRHGGDLLVAGGALVGVLDGPRQLALALFAVGIPLLFARYAKLVVKPRRRRVLDAFGNPAKTSTPVDRAQQPS